MAVTENGPDHGMSGKTAGAEVVWQHLTVEAQRSKKAGGGTRNILTDVSGSAQPGRVTAIMGPSGGGKTTLLNAICNRTPVQAGISVSKSSKLYVDGVPATRTRVRQAYVTQNNLAYAQLTVRETLQLAARLRGTSAERIEYVIGLLGLTNCADTYVGDEKTPGISGGEKKRLAIACDALGDPPIFAADEPTSGLDSFAALQVMQNLQKLARDRGKTVIVSLHQPRGAIWSKIDDLYLLSEGKLMYGGAREEAASFFRELGFHRDDGASDAEYCVDAISVDYSSEDQRKACLTAIDKVAAQCKAKQEREQRAQIQRSNKAELGGPKEQKPLVGPVEQFKLLLGRSWKQVTRDKQARGSRIASTVSSATTFAILFWRLPNDPSSIRSRTGLMQVSAVSTAMTSLVKTIGVFSKEKQIANQERARSLYNAAPLVAAKIISESPIAAMFPLLFSAIVYPSCRLRPTLEAAVRFSGLVTLESFSASGIGMAISAATPSYEAASAIGPASMTMFIVFSSFNPSTPWFLSWIPKISVIGKAVEGFMINEFQGNQFGDVSGDEVLKSQGLSDTSLGNAVKAQSMICIGTYLLTYFLLRRNAPKFVEIGEGEDKKESSSIAENGPKKQEKAK